MDVDGSDSGTPLASDLAKSELARPVSVGETEVARAFALVDAELAAHAPADEKEARDIAFIRRFLREHPRDAHLRAQPEGHLTGSGFVVDDSRTRLLLLHHKKLGRWLQPGGHGEGELHPRAVALREIAEETGLAADDLQPFPHQDLLDVDVHFIPARPGEPAHPHLDFRYGFAARAGALARLSSESTDLRWFPLSGLPEGLDEAARRAIRKLSLSKR
ncbi:MAG TPA: NUDIX domain-containing protein [Myxococcales bacterium]|jgi:8-oxo-dGTP pyrophosphatase MutT (NUDIX family)